MRIPAILRSTTVLPVILMATACVSLTEAQLEARNYRSAEFKQEFIDFRQRCRNAGGRVYIDAKQGLDRHDLPHRGDSYYCY